MYNIFLMPKTDLKTAARSDILVTKITAPVQRLKLVKRARLTEHLWAGMQCKLTTVVAPAGYGKTTLVGDWLRTTSGPAAWLTLDAADNDSNLFLAYLAAALRQARFDLGPDPQAYLQAAQGAALQPVFAGWINRLSVLDTPLTLVLDDYQFITNPAIHEGMAFLLDHLPPRVHLLLATRTDPPLPLHRYRARRQMVEVRADDLRFTPQEIDLFLQQSAGVTLGDEQIRVLDERIEGWAAGIQMAVLSFERQPDLSRFIQSLSGSRRYILDYLAEEVLNNQPPDLRRFLLQISVLERFCVPLCDAVAGGPPGSAAGHLDAIGPRQPCFWPRWTAKTCGSVFHALFSDLLRVRLLQPQSGISGAEVRELHRRASAWFEAQGLLRDAIQHALQAHRLRARR